MDNDYSTLNLDDLYDLLVKTTMKYNQILIQNGTTDESKLLREAMKLLHNEIAARKHVPNEGDL